MPLQTWHFTTILKCATWLRGEAGVLLPFLIFFSNWFLFRKKVDNILTTILPSLVVPLYEMTVFRPEIRYSEAISRSKKQGKIIDTLLFAVPITRGSIYFTHRATVDEMAKTTVAWMVDRVNELLQKNITL